MALAFSSFHSTADAQSPAFIASGNIRLDTDAESNDDLPPKPPKPPLNGYAEKLVPRTKRPAVLGNLPYQPIKKQEDQAQILEIEMFVGESRVFPTPGVARIAVGNGQIMTAAALDNKEVILFANAVGTSSLFVWNDDGRYQRVKINIVPGDTSRFAREIAAFLTAIPNTKASVIGDKVIVEGDNLADLDIAKIEELAKRYPQIVNFTNRLGWEQMVLLDVKVVEFPTSELREIGLKWGATGGAAVGGVWGPARRGDNGGYQINLQSDNAPVSGQGGLPLVVPSGLHVMSLINMGLNAQLNLLAQNGKASVLAEPQLSARNGAKATFLAGGEYPYAVTTLAGPSVMFKPYGIKLEIVPQVDRNGVIRATIDSEVSNIDTSVSTPFGPALSSRRTKTEFNVRNGETLVLSGLLSRKNSASIDKIPFLGDIPVLGALFRSKRFENDETELVVFVTPTVVDSRSPGLVDKVQRTTERLNGEFGKPAYLPGPSELRSDAAGREAPVQPTKDVAMPAAQAAASAAMMPSAADAASAERTATPSVAAPAGVADRAAPGGSSLQIAKDGLVVHAEPHAQSPALMQLGYGSVVQMTAAAPQPPGSAAWRQVVVGNIRGWVESRWVAPSRLEPSLRPYDKGAAVRVDKQGALVGVGNPQVRVAPTASQAVTANAAPAGLEPVPVSKRYRVLLDGLALRVAADVNAPVVQQLPAGTVVQGLPQAPKDYWSPVQVDGKRGWVAAQWLVPAE
jgi:pilus assembly protein CpaC